MYSETVEPKGSRKKLFFRMMIVFFVVAALLTLINRFQFFPGITSILVLLGAAVALFGEYKRNFIRYTYILNEDTFYIDRRIGSFDAIVEELKKEDIRSLQVVECVPEKETRNYCGEKTPIYALTYEKGTFYFTPGKGLVARLSE